MPFSSLTPTAPSFVASLVPLYHAELHPLGAAITQFVTLPGQVLVSFLLMVGAALALRAQGRVEAAVAWLAAWFVGTAVEVVFRHALTRPPIWVHGGIHLRGFDASWPSGHTLRCAIVAAALAAAWPYLRIPLLLWFAACAVLLELAGFHTPTDVLGGLLLAIVVGCGAVELERSGLLRRRAALRGARARPG